MTMKMKAEGRRSKALLLAVVLGAATVPSGAPAMAQDVADPAATDIVLRIRFPAGQVHTHREITAGGSSIAIVPVEHFEGASIYERDGNFFVGVLYRLRPAAEPPAESDPAEPDPIPQPEPEPESDPDKPDPIPADPPAADFELPAVAWAATSGQDGFTAFATGENANAFAEVLGNLFDADPATKWLAWESTPTIQIAFAAPRTVTGLTLTTANDAALRDPAQLTILDGETGESFVLAVPETRARKTDLTLLFPAPLTTATLRIEMTNRGDSRTQLAGLAFLSE